MGRILLLLLCVVLAGCTLQAPPVIESRVLRWTNDVVDRYDFHALSDFVNQTIREPYDWQGLDVSKRGAKDWGFRPGECMLVGEHWIFGSPDPKADAFILITSFPHSPTKFKEVILHCIRRARDRFDLDSIEIEEHDLTGK